MNQTREQHLDWCKARALEVLKSGDQEGAVASMISDLGKWERPLYDSLIVATLQMDGMMFCKTPDQVKHWIEGFG